VRGHDEGGVRTREIRFTITRIVLILTRSG
jgi:hypothetical protein